MSGEYIIGVDLGTSGVRAAIFDPRGGLKSTVDEDYPLETPHPGWAEQDPDRVCAEAERAIQGVLAKAKIAPEAISAISLSSIFHSFIAIDAGGAALTPSIIWADTRAHRQSKVLAAEIDGQALYRRTGCPVHPMYPPAKILWLKAEQPEIFRRIATVGSLKDFVIRRWTGRRAVDLSVASASGMLNLGSKSWDAELLRYLDLDVEQLPELVEPASIVGQLDERTAKAMGLPSGLPMVAGAGDGVLASLGAGAIAPGQMTITIGTSGAARVVSNAPIIDSQGRTWCYYLAADRWVPGAAINNGGLACHWVRDNLIPGPAGPAGEFDFTTLEKDAEAAPPGAGGLLFLPFLTGERSPYWNASARGILFGLAAHHRPMHIARATFEGVCFRMRSIFDALEEVAGRGSEIRATGGFTRSRFWLQMMADMLGRTLAVPEVPEASAFGAAVLGLLATGQISNLDEPVKDLPIRTTVEPDMTRFELYNRYYALYRDIYFANCDAFDRIAALQEQAGA